MSFRIDSMCRVGQIVSIQEDRYYLYDRTPIGGPKGLPMEVRLDSYWKSKRTSNGGTTGLLLEVQEDYYQ